MEPSSECGFTGAAVATDVAATVYAIGAGQSRVHAGHQRVSAGRHAIAAGDIDRRAGRRVQQARSRRPCRLPTSARRRRSDHRRRPWRKRSEPAHRPTAPASTLLAAAGAGDEFAGVDVAAAGEIEPRALRRRDIGAIERDRLRRARGEVEAVIAGAAIAGVADEPTLAVDRVAIGHDRFPRPRPRSGCRRRA